MCTGSTAVFGSLSREQTCWQILKTNTVSFDLVAANVATDVSGAGNDYRQQQRCFVSAIGNSAPF